MSELPPDEPPPPADEDQEPTIFDQPDGTDWYLAWLVNMSDFGVEHAVTLHVSGAIITGTLISGRSFFRELAELTRGRGVPGDGTITDTMATSYEAFAENMYPETQESDRPTRPVGYVHLRNARVITGEGTVIPRNGTLWRGKASAIDGVALGALEVTRG
ncbi:hypothetical protein [Phenylobacterium sp.]|uniref:hypothetical protein n=1 Tax=Phenylobacterium sp. TaxID=1871053 RepID=UPI0035B15A83